MLIARGYMSNGGMGSKKGWGGFMRGCYVPGP